VYGKLVDASLLMDTDLMAEGAQEGVGGDKSLRQAAYASLQLDTVLMAEGAQRDYSLGVCVSGGGECV
jgi:hypothetical protein